MAPTRPARNYAGVIERDEDVYTWLFDCTNSIGGSFDLHWTQVYGNPWRTKCTWL